MPGAEELGMATDFQKNLLLEARVQRGAVTRESHIARVFLRSCSVCWSHGLIQCRGWVIEEEPDAHSVSAQDTVCIPGARNSAFSLSFSFFPFFKTGFLFVALEPILELTL